MRTAASSSKLRPIVPGGVFVKLAGRLAFKALPDLSSLFPPHEQFGLTTKGGAQTLVHSINALLGANPDFLCLSLDIKNAFNSIPRPAVLQELFRHPSLSAIWRISHLFYSSPTNLFLRHRGILAATLSSQHGIWQGDVLSAVLFSLYLKPSLRESLPPLVPDQFPSTTAMALADDVYLVGSPGATLRAFDALQSSLHRRSHGSTVLSPEKCRALARSWDGKIGEAKAQLQAKGFTTFASSLLPSLGSVIGWIPAPESCSVPPATITGLIEAKLQALEPLFVHLKDPRMPLQYSLLILRYCVPTTLGHILRTIPPSFTRAFAEELDRRICSLVSERALLPSPLPPVAQSLFHLPGRFGGVGIPSAARTLSATYWGAFALAVPVLRLHLVSRLPAHLQVAREGLLRDGMDGLPPVADLLEAYASPPRQKGFTSAIFTGLFETTLAGLSASGKAWLRSAQLEGARSTLWTLIPHRPDFRLSDFEVATSLAQWMALPPLA